MDSIPFGLCHCGCGGNTPIAPQTRRAKGHVRGQPVRYIAGHQARRGPADYIVQDAGYITPCWIWQRSKSRGGYGQINRDGKVHRAPRYFYEQVHGPIPERMHLDHLCRNTACVNPDHLEPVTNAENVRRGRATKLQKPQVRAIRAAIGISNTELARQYGVDESTISDIRAHKLWVAPLD